MYTFPSEEWMNALIDILNDSDDYKKAAATWEGSVIFAIEADEKLDKPLYFYANPYHGHISDQCLIDGPDDKEVDFFITGPYATWKDICNRKLDSMQAIMKGKLKIKGSMAKLLKQVKASQAMMKILGDIPTQFIDEM